MATIEAAKLIHDGWQKLHELTIREGSTTYSREVVQIGHAVCVLPYDDRRRVVTLVRQLRPAVLFIGEPAMLLEAPAGLIEPGDSAEDTGKREVEEETGLQVGTLRPLGSFWVSPGSVTQRVTLFLAPYSKRDRVSAGGGLATEHENIEVVELPISEALAMLDRGEITDMKTACLLQALRLAD